MGAVGGSALAAARRRRAVFEAWAAGAGRAGAARAGGVSIRTAGRWLHDTRMSTAARPVAAVESAHGGEIGRRGRRGGALRPSDHRGPDARVSGRAGRGLRLGAAGAGNDRHGPGAGGFGRPHRPPDRPVPADRVGRDPPRGGRGAGSTAGRRRRPRPGRPRPAPRSADWTPTRSCASGSSTRPGDRGRSPGRIAARPRLENPDDGGACAPVRKQIHPGAGCVQGAAGPRLPVAGGGGPAHRTHPPRPPLPAGRRSPGPGARSPMPGAPPTGLRPPRGRRGGRARALGGRPDHRRATPGSALITPAGAPQPVRADHPGGGAAAGSR